MLKIILGDNHFSFNDKQYTLKKRVAMGTKCAPHLANLFMASFEERALNSWQGTEPTKWLRFIDDILMLWKGSREELDAFHQHLNNQMANINFTMEASSKSIVFLDLKIQKGTRFTEKGILDLQLHVKATNPQCFLHFSSCHPFHTFKNILRGEIIRTLRCTSSETAFISILYRLLQKFRMRGYPEWLIRQESEGVNYSQRQELLQPKERRTLQQDVTMFSSIFTPGVKSGRIRKALEDDQTPFSPMVLRPRPTSLTNTLVRAATKNGGPR